MRLANARLAAVLLVVAVVLAAALGVGRRASAGETGWEITSFQAQITIEPDGTLRIIEAIDVDFHALEKHGIFREIPVDYAYDGNRIRHYAFALDSVTDDTGAAWPADESRNGAKVRLRIGDPGRTVSGMQSYRIAYRIAGAMNAFDDHDELYWNVNGFEWGVPALAVSAVVQTPGGIVRTDCFQGPPRSTAPCTHTANEEGDSALFAAEGPLGPGENLTLVAGLEKGTVAVPPPVLSDRPQNWWERNWPPSVASILVAVLGAVAAVAAFLAVWWRHGRDRVYRTMYYLTNDASEQTRPMFRKDDVVVEYAPPDELRPAQLGLILDERADTKDVTATIVDLAVRGYLSIEEQEKSWWFGKQDWRLTRKKQADSALLPFEAEVLSGLFDDGDEADLSDLKNKFYEHLRKAQRELYEDSVGQRWFNRSPDASRNWTFAAGAAVAVGGGVIGWLAGYAGWALAGAPVVLLGALFLLGGSLMSKRTAAGSEALRRALGFRLFIETADKRRQEFNERANIFAEYLPYAIVFGSVEKWANAFEGIDTQPATQSWYTGAHAFAPLAFSQSLQTFSSSLSGVIASTPGGSGGSGFGGGGFSGGGGGGGGGGSW